MIDLARPLTPEIRVVLDTAGVDAGESSVEFRIADQGGMVLIRGTGSHFLTRTLARVRTEMSLHVLAYNVKRVIAICDVAPLLQAIRAEYPG
jgi:hypothetical protein